MGCLLQIVFVCVLGLALSTDAAYTDCKNDAKCVRVEKCAKIYQAIRDKNKGLINLAKELRCGYDNDTPKVCCPPELESNQESQSLLPDDKTCGIQNSDRIVGGAATFVDEHPWMALLRYDKPKGHGFYCGGVIISKRYILTAAHCVKGSDLPPTWKLSQVRLGEWDLKMDKDCQGTDCSPTPVDIAVEETVVHESYSPKSDNQQNDIALLRLAKNINFTDFVKPICLPLKQELLRSSFEDYTMEVAGWGKTETRSASDVKLKVRLPVVPNKQCQQVYRKANRDISDIQICAGGLDGQDSCRGDSGGPLMGQDPSSKSWMVVGVVSYGPSPCGSKGWPGVYTRVTAFAEWIQSKMRA